MRTMRVTRLFLLLVVAACAHHASESAPAPEVLLEKARGQFRSGDFRKALQSFQRLGFELPPNDPSLPEVRYLTVEAQFQLNQLTEAALAFRHAADEFPGSPFAPLALLRAGDANLRLWRKPELDPTFGLEALAIYEDLAGRYPTSNAAARAKLHVQQLREWFADKEYKNGLFYFKRRAFDSGIIYFKDVVARFPDTPRALDALLRLADSYRQVGYREELRETCEHVRRFYPQATGLERSCPPDSSGGR